MRFYLSCKGRNLYAKYNEQRPLMCLLKESVGFIIFAPHYNTLSMGRNKFSATEISEIGRLLNRKNEENRLGQKQIRHILRVKYGFNISDFNIQGKAFGEEDLKQAVRRGRISILDDATVEDMKKRRKAAEEEKQKYREQDKKTIK